MNNSFSRVLRQAGAAELVLSHARQLQCSVCQSHRAPKPPRISALVPSYEFNTVVGLDVFHIEGLSPGQQIHILNMINWSTLYHVCVLVREVTSQWQNGRTERHGGVMKLMFTKARMSVVPKSLQGS